MAVDERARHRLYNRVVEVLGEEEAVILMAHLPPGGYPNLATKQDLLELEERLSTGIEGRVDSLELRLKSYTLRTILIANLAFAAVVTGIAFTAAGLR